MKNNKKSKSSEGAPVAADAPSATHKDTADQAESSPSHGEQHTSESSSDKPSADSPLSEAKPHRAAGSRTVKVVLTNTLKPHPLSIKIYTSNISEDLVESIKHHDIVTPLTVARDTNEVISGNSRLGAAIQLKLKKVPVIYFDSSDPLEIRRAVLESNRQRQKNTEQKIREYLERLDIEKEASKRRMGTNSAKGGVYKSTQAESGKSRDKAGSTIGMSGLHAERGGQVVKAIDELKATGKEAKAKELTEKLNAQSINAAYKSAVESGVIVKTQKPNSKPKPPKAPDTKPAARIEAAVAEHAEAPAGESVAGPVGAAAEGPDSEFTVSSHAEAIAALDAITAFAAHVKVGPHTKNWRPRWVDSVNALCEALAAVGLIIHNVDASE